MLKFTYISKELFEIIKSSLIDFKEVKNQLTGGDDDFVLIDENRKEFSWFENGSFGTDDLIYNDEPFFGNSHIKTLQNLIDNILKMSLISYFGNFKQID